MKLFKSKTDLLFFKWHLLLFWCNVTTVNRFLRCQNLEFLSWLFDQSSLRPFESYPMSWTCAVVDIGSQWSWGVTSRRHFRGSEKGKCMYVLFNYTVRLSKTKLLNSAFQLSPYSYVKLIYVLLCAFNRLHDASSVSLWHLVGTTVV